jgi:hypothetical protein
MIFLPPLPRGEGPQRSSMEGRAEQVEMALGPTRTCGAQGKKFRLLTQPGEGQGIFPLSEPNALNAT